MIDTLREHDEEGSFVVFPGFEVHFCATGDRNMLYKDLEGEILYPTDLADLHHFLRHLTPMLIWPMRIFCRNPVLTKRVLELGGLVVVRC